MRPLYWVLAAAAAALGILWVSSRAVERQAAWVLRSALQPSGALSVRAALTPLGLLRGRVDYLDLEAAGVRLGDLVAGRFAARLRGVTLRRARGVWTVQVRGGTASVEIGQADLERYLRERGVEQPSVRIDASGIEAAGGVRMGPVATTARVQGQFYTASGRDLHFRVASMYLGGTEVPAGVAGAVFAMAGRPVATLQGLPVQLTIDRVYTEPGKVVVRARAGETGP
jgi:hypothetical protein